MSIVVTTEADQTDLTTIAAVKSSLGVSSTKFDAELGRLITAATSAIESYVQHVYARQTYQESVAGTDHPMLMLTMTPIISVTTVLCDSSPVTDFEIHDAAAGILYRQNGWNQEAWVGWGTEYERYPGTSKKNYVITYEAGYLLPGQADADLPAHIEQACIETVVDYYRSGKRDSKVKSKKVGDLAISYETAADRDAGVIPIPIGARALLSRRLK